MSTPVGEDEETEGHTESKKPKGKQWIEKTKKKKENKGKLIFYGKNCLHGSENEKKLKLFKRYCEEKGKMEKTMENW